MSLNTMLLEIQLLYNILVLSKKEHTNTYTQVKVHLPLSKGVISNGVICSEASQTCAVYS